jgi:hypothetical protein
MKPLELIENVLVPALILAAGVLVVQAHAIPYWQATMGLAVGLVASLGAELVGLYLVYQPGRLARWTGLALILVMVLVPAWVILGPEYSAWRGAERAAVESAQAHAAAQAEARARLPLLERDLAAAEASLREDEAKSALRAGWLGELERQRLALAALQAERRDREAALAAPAPARARYDAWAALPKALPVLALLIAFQLANAGAVLRVSGWRFRGGSTGGSEPTIHSEPVQPMAIKSEPPPEPVHASGSGAAPASAAELNRPGEPPVQPVVTDEPPPPTEPVQAEEIAEPPPPAEPVQAIPEPLAGNDLLVKRLQLTLKRSIEATGSRNAFCRQHGLNPRVVTWLGQHFARRKAGQPTISEAKLRELAARFLPAAADAGAGAEG